MVLALKGKVWEGAESSFAVENNPWKGKFRHWDKSLQTEYFLLFTKETEPLQGLCSHIPGTGDRRSFPWEGQASSQQLSLLSFAPPGTFGVVSRFLWVLSKRWNAGHTSTVGTGQGNHQAAGILLGLSDLRNTAQNYR